MCFLYLVSDRYFVTMSLIHPQPNTWPWQGSWRIHPPLCKSDIRLMLKFFYLILQPMNVYELRFSAVKRDWSSCMWILMLLRRLPTSSLLTRCWLLTNFPISSLAQYLSETTALKCWEDLLTGFEISSWFACSVFFPSCDSQTADGPELILSHHI